MIFWDTSAIVPLLVREASSPAVRDLAGSGRRMVVWWGTRTEALSAVARREREGVLSAGAADGIRERLGVLTRSWGEVIPGEDVRGHADRLLLRHPLRAADALQLGAALTLVGGAPDGSVAFACLDARLRSAARREGFGLALRG